VVKEAEDKVFEWECLVCGTIVEGPEPPGKCPVCRADSSKFIKLEEVSLD